VQKCRLEIAGFHAEPIALTKAFAHLYRRQDDEKTTTLYLDVGCSCSKVVIAHGDEIRFARSVPVGGRHFDQRLAEKMSCDAATARARRLKEAQTAEGETPATGESRSFDARSVHSQNQAAATAVATDRRATSVPPDFSDVGDGDQIADILGDGRSTDNPVRSATGDLVRQLAEEARMCLRYHRRLFADRTIDRLVFIGGESRDAALCREIAQQVGVPAYQGDPFSRLRRSGGEIDLDDIQPHPGWAVPIGLCDCPAE
jgi:Tfp pilus assembly PilM family ATPase